MCDLCHDWFHGDCLGMDEKTIEALQAYTCPSCLNLDEDRRRSLPALAAANDAKTDRDAEVEAALGEKEKAREAERQAALAKRSSPKSKRVAESKEEAGDTVEGAISPYVTRDKTSTWIPSERIPLTD